MATVSVVNRFTTVQGPFKEEVIIVDAASSQDAEDTSIDTLLQNPIARTIEAANYDLATGAADAASVEAGTNAKDLTLNDLVNDRRYVIRIIGF